MQRLLWILPVLLLSALPAVLWARPPAYRMTLTISTDKAVEFVLEVELDDRQFSAIRNDPDVGIRPFLLQARKQAAERSGYRREIHGEDHYKMVVVRRVSIIIRNLGQERIVFKKN